MKKIKTYVLTVSKTFPAKHKRVGEETFFVEKILSGEKIHTIRANYPLWKNRIDEIQKGNAILSLRYWSDKPYNSKQVEFMQLDKDSGIGVQKIIIKDWFRELYYSFQIDDRFFPGKGLAYTSWREFYAKLIAKKDGLTFDQFKDWFKNYDLSKPMAIIHFTNFRY